MWTKLERGEGERRERKREGMEGRGKVAGKVPDSGVLVMKQSIQAPH
jgi:hypothetical protein